MPKQDNDLPDTYGIKIFYVNGKVDDFQLASHNLNKELSILEFWSKDDLCSWVPLSSVQRVEFDKNFSKMVAIRSKIDKKVGANGS